MKTIIVPTDFSPAALNAVNYAADMANAIDAELLLLHVFHILVSYTEVPPIIDADQMKREFELKINELKEQLDHKYGNKLNVKTEVREGTFINELESVCEDIKPFAVVMGSQGSSASSYRLFGSQSVNTMRQIKWPVIAVPRGAKFGDVRKIGLACDFENVVEKTPIDEIKKLVNNFNAELHVLNTRKKQEQDPQMVFESGLLMEMLTPLSHEYHFITNDNIDQGIMDFCEKNNMDLLVVMPGRHNLLDKLIHKSHTKNLVIHSHVPLMALHE